MIKKRNITNCLNYNFVIPLIEVVACMFFGFALFLHFYELPQLSDVGCFMAIGQELNFGDKLYIDVWDNKAPGIFLLHSITQFLLGHNIFYPSIIQAVLSAYSLMRFCQIFKCFVDKFYLLLIGFVYMQGYFIITEWRYFFNGGFTEEIGMYINLISISLLFSALFQDPNKKYTNIKVLISGLLFGFVLLVKEPFVFFYFGYISILLKFSSSNLRFKFITFNLGILLTIISYLLYLILNNNLFNYFEYLIFATHYANVKKNTLDLFINNSTSLYLNFKIVNIGFVFMFLLSVFEFLYIQIYHNDSNLKKISVVFFVFCLTSIPFYLFGGITYEHYYIPIILNVFIFVIVIQFLFLTHLMSRSLKLGAVYIYTLIILSFYGLIIKRPNIVTNSISTTKEFHLINKDYLKGSNCYIDDQSAGRFYYYLQCTTNLKFPCPYFIYYYGENVKFSNGIDYFSSNTESFKNKFISDPPSYLITLKDPSIAMRSTEIQSFVKESYKVIDSFVINDTYFILKLETLKI